MKVAIVTESIIDYSVEFANAVSRQCDTLLLAPARHLDRHWSYFEPSLRVPKLDWPRIRSPLNAFFLGTFLSELRGFQPDVVHVVSHDLTWPTFTLPFRGGSVLVETVHDLAIHPGDTQSGVIPRPIIKFLRSQADGIVVHSEAMRPAAAKMFNRPLDRVFAIPHLTMGRYAQIATKLEPLSKENKFEVLFFGRVFLYKGVDYLIAAAEKLSQRIPNLRVTIAGTGDDMPRCRALITKPELFEIHDSYVPDDESALLMQRADVLVLPYIEASQSGVTAVSTAFGKPVVATDVGDFREAILGDKPYGLIVPPCDSNALANAIATLYANPAQREALGKAAYAVAWGNVRGPDAIAAKARALYEALLGGPRASDGEVVPARSDAVALPEEEPTRVSG